MPTRDEIRDKLGREQAALAARYRAMPAVELTRECTESQEPDGEPWTAKDHLAHLAMIERAFQAMIERGIAGHERPVGLGGGSRDEVIARVHQMNQTNVHQHRDDDLETLLTDLDAARADTLALLDRLTDEQLASALPGAPWADGTIGGVLLTNAHHQLQHLAWVEEGLAGG